VSFPSDEQASELRDLFFESAQEILQGMNEAGLALEGHPGDVEQLRHVRRAVHTLKGDSAACGYRELSELAHDLEDVLTPELAKQNAGLIAEVILTAADTFHEIEEGVVRLGLHDLERELLDRRLVERTEHDPLGAVVLETRERAEESDGSRPWTERDQPCDRQRRHARREHAQRSSGAAIGPMHIVEEQDQGPVS